VIIFFSEYGALVLFICLELAQGKATCLSEIIQAGALCANCLSMIR